MGQIREPENVCLICAITFKKVDELEKAIDFLTEKYGNIMLKSPVYNFDHTNYYQQEMGSGLEKVFLAFNKLIHPKDLPEIKLYTNEIEQQFLTDGKRQINLDPGYVEAPKLVLATTKNYEHRIYLDKNIYGDVQLRLRKDGIQTNPWTYPDYKEKIVLEFFEKVKSLYMKKLRTRQDTDQNQNSGKTCNTVSKLITRTRVSI